MACRAGLAVLALTAPCWAFALGPSAPFTPPRATDADAVSAASESSATPASATTGTSTSPTEGLQGLQGLRLGGRPMALIDGQWWAPGGRPRGALLTTLTRQGAWLRHDDGRREFLALLAQPVIPLPMPAAHPPRPAVPFSRSEPSAKP